MHEMEDVLSCSKKLTQRKMCKNLSYKSFANNKVSNISDMSNAGVIAIPKYQHISLIKEAILVCDALLETNCPTRLIEQFSFSLILQNRTKLKNIDREIIHYWGKKEEWNEKINLPVLFL